MSGSQRGIAVCHVCDRRVATSGDRYVPHSSSDDTRGTTCPMSRQRVPVTGMSEIALESRAHLVADLATQVQDCDPAVVWTYLTGLPAVEVQRLLVIALAAVPVDKTVRQMFRWVERLPDAKEASA